MAKVCARTDRAAETGSPLLLSFPFSVSASFPASSGPRRSGVISSVSPSGESYRRSTYAWYTPALADGPCLAGGGEDISGPGHGRLGPGLGDGGGARGGRGPDGLRGGNPGRDGGGERPHEGVARAHGVDRLDGETLDDAPAVRAGQGGAVGARGDHGVPWAVGDQFGGGVLRGGQAADRVAEGGGGLGLVHHQPVQLVADGGDERLGFGRGGGQVEHADAGVGERGPDRGERDLGADDQDVA